MKNIFRLLMFVGAVSFASCEDKSGLDNWFDKPEPVNTLEVGITAGAVDVDGTQIIEIGPDNQWETITFSWTEALPPTADYHITGYKLKVNMSGGDSADYTTKVLSPDARSYTLSKRELYKFMIANWGYHFGSPTDMVVTVIADIDGGQFYFKPVVTSFNFQLTPTEIPALKFYIVGEANPKGTTAADGLPITMRNLDAFYQTGATDDGQDRLELKPNSTFMISLQLDSEYPAFVCGEKLDEAIEGTPVSVDGYKLVYVESAEEAAKYDKFHTKGEFAEGSHGSKNSYAISIEVDDMNEVLGGNVYFGRYCTQSAWIVGDAVNGEWSHVKMNWDYRRPEVVYRQGHWYDITTTPNNQGAIKIHGSNNWSDPSWRPINHGANPLNDNRATSNSSGDPKWVLPGGTDGYYRFELNNAEMTISMLPYEHSEEK